MVLPLLLSLAAPAPSGAAATAVRRDDPPVKVWLDQGKYQRGDKAHVSVKLGGDGYLVVLRGDAQGRVRVLYPLDPGDDAFVRGGQTLEVRGRGDREAFSIDEREGSGLVLAARSVTPFKVDEFMRGDHWDYHVLTVRDAGDDTEQTLLDIVQRMVPDGHFDFDAVSYTVASPRASYDGAYSPYSSSIGLGLGYGFGWPRSFRFSLAFGDPFFFRPFFFRASCFDPFFFDPFFCDPAPSVLLPAGARIQPHCDCVPRRDRARGRDAGSPPADRPRPPGVCRPLCLQGSHPDHRDGPPPPGFDGCPALAHSFRGRCRTAG